MLRFIVCFKPLAFTVIRDAAIGNLHSHLSMHKAYSFALQIHSLKAEVKFSCLDSPSPVTMPILLMWHQAKRRKDRSGKPDMCGAFVIK